MVQRLVSKMGLPALLVGIAAILAIAASSALLAWSYKDQLTELRSTIYHRCQQRTGYDESNHEAVGGQLAWLKSQRQRARLNASTNEALIRTFPPDLRPGIRTAQVEQRAALDKAISTFQHAYDSGVISNCSVYR